MAEPKKVVATLEYDAEWYSADDTISFARRQLNMRTMVAEAENVAGVRYANSGLGDGDQELEIRITAHHAQTLAGAKAVMEAVLRKLNLTPIGDIRVRKQARFAKGKRPTKRAASNSLLVQSPSLHGRKK